MFKIKLEVKGEALVIQNYKLKYSKYSIYIPIIKYSKYDNI